MSERERVAAERERVAKALHDDIGGTLTAAGVQLELLRMDYRERDPEVAARAGEIQELLERAMERLRGLARQLRGVE